MIMNMRSIKKLRFLHGYRILMACLCLLFLYGGVGYYAFAIFFKSIQEELVLSRTVVSIAFTLFYLVIALSSPFVGRLVDRFGPKKIIFLGGLILGLGLTFLSSITNLQGLYMAYMITGLGCSTIGLIPVSAIVSDLFLKRRGMAMGIVGSGIGVGGLVLSPILGTFLIPHFGWRAAYQILALLTVTLVITVAVVIEVGPRKTHLHLDRVEASETITGPKSPSDPSEGCELSVALKTSSFWLITSVFVMFQMAEVGIIQHLVNHLTDVGFSIVVAAAVLSLNGLCTTIGKLWFGYISDRLAAKYCAAISFLLALMATILLITSNPLSNPLAIWIFAFLMGLSIGSWVPLSYVLISSKFGLANYGAIYGVWSLFTYTAVAISPAFFGYVFDIMSSYYWAFITSAVLLSAGLVSVLFLQNPRTRVVHHQ